jgi:steroid delta-isomerase
MPAPASLLGAVAGAAALLALACTGAAAAGTEAAEAEIRQALATWTERFNARDAGRICDLFAPDLRYDYRGFPERDYEAICSNLKRSLSDPAKQYTYMLDIKEILVFGDAAAVRLVWTLKVRAKGAAEESVSQEPGLDLFGRQPDGSWRIVRYLAYEDSR